MGRGASSVRWRVWRYFDVRRRSGPAERPAGGASCRYLAIIMDGNGRWAARRHLPVAAGHRAGVKALRRVLEHALDLGIQEVTVFSFSSENWTRPAGEVEELMDLFVDAIETQVPDLHERGARVRFVGRREGVPAPLVARIEAAERLTAGNSKMTLFIAFNYGGRGELVDAVRGVLASGASAADVDAQMVAGHLYAPDMHEPELLIRTSGEQRISNFLLWQLAYSELYFSPKLWPDFDEADLDAALAEYAGRLRRFGGR